MKKRSLELTEKCREQLRAHESGTVIVVKGPELDAMAAAETIWSKLHPPSNWFDAKDVMLGVLSWNNSDSSLYDAFKFSMKVFASVGFGFVDKEFASFMNHEKQARFKTWFQQSVKKRAQEGKSTVIAMVDVEDALISKFVGVSVMSQHGIIMRAEDVVKVRIDKRRKFARKGAV
jgi:hypothetical protein